MPSLAGLGGVMASVLPCPPKMRRARHPGEGLCDYAEPYHNPTLFILMIHFNCPSCGRNYSVPDEFAGRPTKCRVCNNPVRVPPGSRHLQPPFKKNDSEPIVVATPVEDGESGSVDDVIPNTHRHLLLPGEKPYHFEWMDVTGGCGTVQASKHYILITDRRVLYEAAVKHGDGMNLKYVRTSGSIPISKVSFVGTSTQEAGWGQSQQGCNPQKAHLLRVNSGGGTIEFPFFSEAKVKRVQRVIEELISGG